MNDNEDEVEAPVEQDQPIEVKEEPKEKKSWFNKKKIREPKVETKQEPVQEKPKKQRKSFFKKRQPGEPGKIKKTINQWKRTLEVARKPGKEEFLSSAKITGIGIALLGFIGFIIFMLFQLVK